MFEAADQLAALPRVPLTEAEWKQKSMPRVRKGVPPVHVVADTNTVVSGLLCMEIAKCWTPRAQEPLRSLPVLLAELAEVLQRPKVCPALGALNVTPHTLVFGLRRSHGWSRQPQLRLSSKWIQMTMRCSTVAVKLPR